MQYVSVDGDIYVGGGIIETNKDDQSVFKYDIAKDEWTRLTDHLVFLFGLCSYQGELASVGGVVLSTEQTTNKVYRYRRDQQKWVEYLEPMLTERANPTLLTTASAIVACGGRTKGIEEDIVTLATVEVYTSNKGTSRWYFAGDLPEPCTLMSSATLNARGYMLGGHNDNDLPIKSSYCVDLETIIHIARSSDTYLYASTSTWMTLPDTPLLSSTVVALGGYLFAVGGYDGMAQSSVHVFESSTNSWLKLPFGNLPTGMYAATALQLSADQLMVIGGRNTLTKDTSLVYIGTLSYRPSYRKFQPDHEEDDHSLDNDSYLEDDTYLELLPPSSFNFEPSWAPLSYLEKGKH